jgi:hypothetical protein
MKRHMSRWIAASFLAAVAAGAAVNDEGFERYRVILERKPFGNLPPPPGTGAAEAAKPTFAQSFRLCTIIENDGVISRVGFIDTRSNKSYLMGPGESVDGIEVVSANFDDEEAVLRQGAEMVLVNFESGVATPITEAEQEKRVADAQARPSYADRRKQRQEQLQKQLLDQQQQFQEKLKKLQEQKKEEPPPPPPEPKYTGEELTRHLGDYQMEVIRQGLPPLPLALTPEQDAQLVQEGILPPQE